MGKDIHNYIGNLDAAIRRVKNSDLDDDNKKLILDFDRFLLLVERLSVPRRLRIMGTISRLATLYFHGDLRKVTGEDIKDCVVHIESKPYSAWTKAGYKVVIRKFFKWVAYGDAAAQTKEVPEIVRWIKVHVRNKDRRRVQASDILTEDEVHRLFVVANTSRDRAFIAMIYELGARVGEMGGLDVGDVTRDKYSFIVDLNGKTGHRTPRIVISDAYLTEWLDHHPLNKDPHAPLWISSNGKGGFKRMTYAALRALVRRLGKKAGITKRIYPHLFRHTRVTHLMNKRQLNEGQAKVYFGWTPDSRVLSDYSHLVSQDVNETILKIHGIKVDDDPEKETSKMCPRCKQVNAVEARFCIHCSSILDAETAFREQEAEIRQDDLLNTIMRDAQVQQAILNGLLRLNPEMLKKLLPAEIATRSDYKLYKPKDITLVHE